MNRLIGILLILSGLFLMYSAVRQIQEVRRLQAMLKVLETQSVPDN